MHFCAVDTPAGHNIPCLGWDFGGFRVLSQVVQQSPESVWDLNLAKFPQSKAPCADVLMHFKSSRCCTYKKVNFPWFPCSFPWSDCRFYAIILQSLRAVCDLHPSTRYIDYINYINLLLGWGVRPAYKSNRHGQRAGHQLGKNCLGLDDVHDDLFESYKLEIFSGRHDFHPALFIILYSHCQTYFSRSCAGTCAVHMQYFDISLLTPISHHDSTQFFSRLVLFCTAEVSFSRVDRCPLGICRCEGCLGSMSGKL